MLLSEMDYECITKTVQIPIAHAIGSHISQDQN